MFKKQVCLIVIIAENDWYGLIQNFDFPRGVFLPFQIVGEKPRRVFWKIQIDFFELLFITMHNKRYINNFQHYIVPLEEKENSPAGFFPPRGFSPTKWNGRKPLRVFYPKIIFSVFSSKKYFTLCVQSCESFISKQRDFNFSLGGKSENIRYQNGNVSLLDWWLRMFCSPLKNFADTSCLKRTFQAA